MHQCGHLFGQWSISVFVLLLLYSLIIVVSQLGDRATHCSSGSLLWLRCLVSLILLLIDHYLWVSCRISDYQGLTSVLLHAWRAASSMRLRSSRCRLSIALITFDAAFNHFLKLRWFYPDQFVDLVLIWTRVKMLRVLWLYTLADRDVSGCLHLSQRQLHDLARCRSNRCLCLWNTTTCCYSFALIVLGLVLNTISGKIELRLLWLLLVHAEVAHRRLVNDGPARGLLFFFVYHLPDLLLNLFPFTIYLHLYSARKSSLLNVPIII